jgi:hypothetical protein
MWGQSEARAIDMLVKKINDAGGVLGKEDRSRAVRQPERRGRGLSTSRSVS